MRYKFFQYPRGVNKGGILNTEICPTISTSSWENNCFLIEIEECDSKENILTPTKVSTGTQHKSSSEDNLGGISRTVKTDDSLAIMEEVKIATMRGRNPDNPSERGKSNGNYKQRLEVNENGTSNTITSVQKDNLVVEPLNSYKDGTCRTIKAQYQQSSRANFARQDGLGATGVVQIGNIYPDQEGFKNRTAGRIYSADGLSPTLRTMSGGHQEPKIVEEEKPKYRIRKLTCREVFRLMGCDEETIDTIQAAGISNSQQYKLAGNSIVVDVLYHLFRKMFVETENESQQLTLF